MNLPRDTLLRQNIPGLLNFSVIERYQSRIHIMVRLKVYIFGGINIGGIW